MGFTAGLEEGINWLFEPLANISSTIIFYSIPVGEASLPLIVVWLVAAAAFFTAYFRLLNIRAFGVAVRIAFGRLDSVKENTERGSAGEIDHFQALTAAV
mgnify:CR=1 FL=1